MFTVNHLIWFCISIALIVCSLVWLRKNKPSLSQVLIVCCVVCVLSELIKIFSVMKLVPSSDGSMYYPYMELQHLPFHLCSIQLFTIFYVTLKKQGMLRDIVLGFMYPTCIMGAFLSLCMPSIFSTSISIDQAFTHPLAYQFFIYHSMLIVLGIYIKMSGEVDLKAGHYFTTMGLLGFLAVVSLYLNSMFATPVYENGVLQSVEYTTNFFFTYKLPISIAITEIWQWYLYLGVIVVLAIVLVGLFYIPVFKKHYEQSRQKL